MAIQIANILAVADIEASSIPCDILRLLRPHIEYQDTLHDALNEGEHIYNLDSWIEDGESSDNEAIAYLNELHQHITQMDNSTGYIRIINLHQYPFKH